MSKPSIEQKAVLREQLAKMDGGQWLAMMHWFILQVAVDQEYFTTLIFDELERRKKRERENTAHNSSDAEHFLSIMKDLRTRIVTEHTR